MAEPKLGNSGIGTKLAKEHTPFISTFDKGLLNRWKNSLSEAQDAIKLLMLLTDPIHVILVPPEKSKLLLTKGQAKKNVKSVEWKKAIRPHLSLLIYLPNPDLVYILRSLANTATR